MILNIKLSEFQQYTPSENIIHKIGLESKKFFTIFVFPFRRESGSVLTCVFGKFTVIWALKPDIYAFFRVSSIQCYRAFQ